MGMTMAEKILARTAGKPAVTPGEYVDCKLDGIVAMQGFVETHNHAIAAGLPEGLPKIWDPDKFFMMIEHHQPATVMIGEVPPTCCFANSPRATRSRISTIRPAASPIK